MFAEEQFVGIVFDIRTKMPGILLYFNTGTQKSLFTEVFQYLVIACKFIVFIIYYLVSKCFFL